MTLHVYTARIDYRGPAALDITRGAADKARKENRLRPPGEFLAPSARLVFPTLRRLKEAATEGAREAVWRDYEAAFRSEMARSWASRRNEWDALLDRDRIVLLCFCVNSRRCHRPLVADELQQRGAVNHGELTSPRPSCVICDPTGGACFCGFRRPGEGPPADANPMGPGA